MCHFPMLALGVRPDEEKPDLLPAWEDDEGPPSESLRDGRHSAGMWVGLAAIRGEEVRLGGKRKIGGATMKAVRTGHYAVADVA